MLVENVRLHELSHRIHYIAYVYDANGDGILDDVELALRAMANEVFTMLNEVGDIVN